MTIFNILKHWFLFGHQGYQVLLLMCNTTIFKIFYFLCDLEGQCTSKIRAVQSFFNVFWFLNHVKHIYLAAETLCTTKKKLEQTPITNQLTESRYRPVWRWAAQERCVPAACLQDGQLPQEQPQPQGAARLGGLWTSLDHTKVFFNFSHSTLTMF